MGSKNKRKNMTEAVTDTRKDTYDWIQCLISALIICVLLFVFVIRVVDVRGTSMWNGTLRTAAPRRRPSS